MAKYYQTRWYRGDAYY